MKTVLQLIFIFFLTTNLFAQNKLIFHTESVDSLLVWMDKGCDKSKIINFVEYPANQLMEQLLKTQERNAPSFKKVLEEYNYRDTTSGSSYLINDAYKKRVEIGDLLNNIIKSDFSEGIYKRVMKYFPDGYTPARKYDVYFTATGWKWGDAMAFNYKFENGKYTLSGKGKSAIIFNLTLVSSLYGNTLTEQIEALKDVMSHELFHAILADYSKSKWNGWNNETIENNTLYLMFNEGLAHYISDGKSLRNDYNNDSKLMEKEKAASVSLANNAKIIFNKDYEKDKRIGALRKGLYGKFWGKYICISGLFMAYHIEQSYGLEGLVECIKKGPLCFFRKYKSLCEKNAVLPSLPEGIANLIREI